MGAWGKLYEVVSEQIEKLNKAGFCTWAITHDKDKSFTTREGLEYNKTTLSVSGKVRDVFVNMADFIVFIELTKEMTDGKLIDKRYIHFRGDSTLEAGSRFEKIPNKIEYDPKAFVETIEQAVLDEYGGDKKAVEKAKKEQAAEKKKKSDEFIKQQKLPSNEDLVNKIKAKFSDLDESTKAKIKEVMNKYKMESLKDPDVLNTDGLIEIVKIIE